MVGLDAARNFSGKQLILVRWIRSVDKFQTCPSGHALLSFSNKHIIMTHILDHATHNRTCMLVTTCLQIYLVSDVSAR